jgi:hypothetical protein
LEEKGFFGSLFDISFSSFITTKIVKVLYVLSLILIGLFALGFVISAFSQSAALGLVVLLIVAPLGALLYAIYTRVILEVLIAIFRIMESNFELVRLQRSALASAAPPLPTSGPGPSASPPPPAPPTEPLPPSTPPPPPSPPQ